MSPPALSDMNHQSTVEAIHTEVAERMQAQGAGHGLDHVQRVWRMAKFIQGESGGDLLVIELAALLHDLGDAKFHNGVERSGEFAREILSRLSQPTELIEHVCQIVDRISFRHGAAAQELTLEGQIVQDADRLDAMGAIGIVRVIEYGAFIGRRFDDQLHPNEPSGLKHFDEKLLKLLELLNTESARRIGRRRDSFMRAFLSEYHTETGGTP